MEYVDAIMIVDQNGKIVYSVRYNPRFDKDSRQDDFENIINKNFLEVYPTIDLEESSVINCLKNGTSTYNKNQILKDYKGRFIHVSNVTIPIMRSGKILGAIELSKDITKIDENISQRKRKSNFYSNKFSKKDKFDAKYNFKDIITRNIQMKENIKRAKMAANTNSSILVYGETGTGKELYVQSIHNYSLRRNRPFIAQNCAALPETLFESILFGSVKGAFTGAENKAGLFELANGGTLFLDEINSMPLSLQAKLLRVLQDGVIRRIGDFKEKKVDVRIIAAMNIEPLDAVNKKELREDLFYRLNVVNLKLIPLRDRKEDILLYVNYFIQKYNKKFDKKITCISKEVEELFMKYNWPGNVRELEHVIEASINFIDKGGIQLNNLPVYLSDKIEQKREDNMNEKYCSNEAGTIQSLDETIEKIEKDMILDALRKTRGNITKAANILKISRQRLHYKLNKFNIHIT